MCFLVVPAFVLANIKKKVTGIWQNKKYGFLTSVDMVMNNQVAFIL